MGFKVYDVRMNGIRLGQQPIQTLSEFNSWIVTTLGGNSSSEIHRDVKEYSDGSYVAVGTGNSVGSNRGIIVKYDTNLVPQIQKGLGESPADIFFSVVVNDDDTCVVSGYTQVIGGSQYDAWVVKYDSNLNKTGEVVFADVNGNNDYFRCIKKTTDGGYLVVGQGIQTFDREGIIIKLDSNLNIVDGGTYSITSGQVTIEDIIEIPSGYIAVGSFDVTNYQALIMELDSNFNIVTQKSLGGGVNDLFRSIKKLDNGYIVVGNESSEGQGSYDAFVVEFDNSLNVVTQKYFGNGNSEYFYSIEQTNSGGYMAFGHQNSVGQGSYDLLIVEYDSNLNVIDTKGLGTSSTEYAQDAIKSSDGSFVVCGQGGSNSNALITKIPSSLSDISDGTLSNQTEYSWYTPTYSEGSTTLTLSNSSLTKNTLNFTETVQDSGVLTFNFTETTTTKP